MHPNPKIIGPILLLIAIFGGAAWYFTQNGNEGIAGALAASGTIEGTQVVIAPELGGRVLEILVQEGEVVEAGQTLVRFDDALIQAQLSQSEAAAEIARANYDLAARGPTDQQRQLSIVAAELALIDAQQALQMLQEGGEMTEAQLLQAIAVADKTRDEVQQYFDNIIGDADPADIDAAWASVVIAQDKLEKAQEDYAPYEKKKEDNLTRAIFLAKLAAAEQQYDTLVYRYNNLVGTSNQYVLAVAEADLNLAEATLADLERDYAELVGGVDPDALALAEARVKVAEANLATAKAETSKEELAAAQAQLVSAESALSVLQVQARKNVISAPVDGVVLVRSVEPGEVLVAGAPLLTLLGVDDLTITVYIPEDRYGQIRIGQAAVVVVDSFPGEVFKATVLRIADKAEFTPRNVQTVEGRRTTVFAIELAVSNSDGKLRPGMPADVTFGR